MVLLLWAGIETGITGCRSLPLLPPMDLREPGWTVRQGQAVWRSQREAPEIAGELLVALHPDGQSMVQFTKPPFPFVVAQRTTNGWQAQFLAQDRIYSGRGKSPARIVWLHLPDALIGRLSSAAWRFQDQDAGSWRMENPSTGEILEGFLHVTTLPQSHRVRPHDTLPGLARWFGVSADALRSVNPGAEADWFRVGSDIKLPPAAPPP